MTATPLLGAALQAPPRDGIDHAIAKGSKVESAADGVIARRLVSVRERRLATTIAAVLVLSAAGLTPLCGIAMPHVPGFVACYATASLMLYLLVAALLLCKAKIEQDGDHSRLAVPFMFCGVIVVLHFLSFPNALLKGSILGDASSPAWLWIFWHAGFALSIIDYSLRQDGAPAPPNLLRAILVAAGLSAVLGYLALSQTELLPPITFGHRLWESEYGVAAKLIVLALSVLSLVLLVAKHRLRTSRDLWLAVGVLGLLFEIWLSGVTRQRYDLGWYVSRFGGFAGISIVFISELYDILLSYGRVAAANVQLDKLSLTDALTNLGNRRSFDNALTTEWRRCRRNGMPLSVVMIDVDNFKAFNDCYGHQAGDICLVRVATQLGTTVSRPGDLAMRYGDEEFALILPDTDSDGASHLARVVRLRIRDLGVPNIGSVHGMVTVSMGVATLVPSDAFSAIELIRLADLALYRAKASGRDTVGIAGKPV